MEQGGSRLLCGKFGGWVASATMVPQPGGQHRRVGYRGNDTSNTVRKRLFLLRFDSGLPSREILAGSQEYRIPIAQSTIYLLLQQFEQCHMYTKKAWLKFKDDAEGRTDQHVRRAVRALRASPQTWWRTSRGSSEKEGRDLRCRHRCPRDFAPSKPSSFPDPPPVAIPHSQQGAPAKASSATAVYRRIRYKRDVHSAPGET